MKYKYEIIIFWSDEDASFIAEVPELSGCSAHGESYDAALHEIQLAMDLWIKTAVEFKRSIPQPKGERLMFA